MKGSGCKSVEKICIRFKRVSYGVASEISYFCLIYWGIVRGIEREIVGFWYLSTVTASRVAGKRSIKRSEYPSGCLVETPVLVYGGSEQGRASYFQGSVFVTMN